MSARTRAALVAALAAHRPYHLHAALLDALAAAAGDPDEARLAFRAAALPGWRPVRDAGLVPADESPGLEWAEILLEAARLAVRERRH
jgi:hypothetical protein